MVDELEAVYGPAAQYSEHQPGESITYRDAEGVTRSGVIIWVCAAGVVAGRELPLRYIVDANLGMPDMCLPADIIEQ